MPQLSQNGQVLGSFATSSTARGRVAKSNRAASHKSAPLVERMEGRTLLSASYYVAPGGSDSNPGTLGAPFHTIQRAADAGGSGDVINILGGTYRETVTPKSGETFRAFNGQNVVIDGADPITGWSGYSGAISKASQPWDMGQGKNQVFVDGTAMTEARWPNTSLDVSHQNYAHVAIGYGSSSFYDSALAGINAVGATIHITSGQGWVAQSGTVIAQSGGRVTLRLANESDPLPGIRGGTRYYLTGKLSFLDSPNEAFRDSSGTLYLWAPNGTAGHLVEAKHRMYAFNLKGRSGVTIDGIKIIGCSISSGGTNNVTINNVVARYTSKFDILANGWQPYNDSGLSLIGNNNKVTNSVVDSSYGDGIYLQGVGNTAQNDVVTNSNIFASDASAIRIWGSHNTVDHCTIAFSGRSGVKWATSTASKVTYNLIHDVMLQTSDGGGVYTYGTNGAGSEMAYNRIYNIHTGGWGSAALYLDNNSSNYYVHNNSVYNVDIALKMNPTNYNEKIINNNLIGSLYSINSYGSEDASGSLLQNNVMNGKVTLKGRVTYISNRTSGDAAGTFFVGATIGGSINPTPSVAVAGPLVAKK